MTISTTTSKVTYAGNGVTTVFTFPFVGDSSSTLQVFYTNPNGVVSLLPPTAYTLTINATSVGQLWGIGGTVTYPIVGTPPVPIATGSLLTISRDVPYEQTVTISNQGSFYPQAVEMALDLLELQIQQLVTDLEYTIQTPQTDLVPPNVLPVAADRANGLLGFDVDGQPTIVFTTVTPAPPSTATTRRVTVTGTTTTNILTTDSFGGISLYQSGTPVATLQLPVAGEGPYPVFDGSLNASTYPITILPSAGTLIMGASSYILAFNGQSVIIYFDGNQWLVN